MKKLPTLLVIYAGVAMFSSGAQCFAQNAEPDSNENEVRWVQIRLRTEGTEVASPELHGGRLPLNEGHARVGLSFAEPPPAGAPNFGTPNSGTPGLRMGTRSEMHQGQGPQIRHLEAHGPEGPFAEDRRRIAALTESAERIARAGLPDVARGLRERAGEIERELVEKHERMQQEDHRRAQAEVREHLQQQRRMEQRREGLEHGDHSAQTLRELHEQVAMIRNCEIPCGVKPFSQ